MFGVDFNFCNIHFASHYKLTGNSMHVGILTDLLQSVLHGKCDASRERPVATHVVNYFTVQANRTLGCRHVRPENFEAKWIAGRVDDDPAVQHSLRVAGRSDCPFDWETKTMVRDADNTYKLYRFRGRQYRSAKTLIAAMSQSIPSRSSSVPNNSVSHWCAYQGTGASVSRRRSAKG